MIENDAGVETGEMPHTNGRFDGGAPTKNEEGSLQVTVEREEQRPVLDSRLDRQQLRVYPELADQVELNSVQNVGPLLDALHLADARNLVSSRLAVKTPKRYGGQREKQGRH